MAAAVFAVVVISLTLILDVRAIHSVTGSEREVGEVKAIIEGRAHVYVVSFQYYVDSL